MKSLHTRLDPIKDEVLKVTETFGPFRAMTMFKVADYPGFRRWLKDVTQNENFGLRPKISLDGRQSLGDQLVDAFLRKVAELEADRDRWKQRAEYLEWQVAAASEKEMNQALTVLQTCEV